MKKKKIVAILLFIFLTAILCIYTYIYMTENVHLGKYKGLTTKMTVYKVTDGDIENSLKKLASTHPTIEKEYQGFIESGDLVNVDFICKDGNLIIDTATNKNIDVTAGEYDIGFENKLIGMMVGESADIIVNYSDSFENSDLAGKQVTYTVNVNYKKIEKIEDITDEFVKQLKNIRIS